MTRKVYNALRTSVRFAAAGTDAKGQCEVCGHPVWVKTEVAHGRQIVCWHCEMER